MSPEAFAYWMQGIAETSDGPPSEKQWRIIKDHLYEVFTKVTPDREESFAAINQNRSRHPRRKYDMDRIREMIKEIPVSSRGSDLLIC